MFQLLLIRHAQSANNALPESERVPDPGLTPLGVAQANALSDWLVHYRPTSLFCSGFRRALETTLPIATKLSMRPSVRLDLYEQGGCYSGHLPNQRKSATGMGKSQIIREFGDWIIDDRISESGWYHGCELESDDQAIERSHSVARWIVEKHLVASHESKSLTRTAFIIHADFKSLLLESLLHKQPSKLPRFDRPYSLGEVWNASVTQLTWIEDRWQLDFWNSIGHLPVDHWTN